MSHLLDDPYKELTTEELLSLMLQRLDLMVLHLNEVTDANYTIDDTGE
jgi:hypothetical protein